MATTEDLTRFVLRALGAILMISGGLETLLGFTLGMVLIQPAFAIRPRRSAPRRPRRPNWASFRWAP